MAFVMAFVMEWVLPVEFGFLIGVLLASLHKPKPRLYHDKRGFQRPFPRFPTAPWEYHGNPAPTANDVRERAHYARVAAMQQADEVTTRIFGNFIRESLERLEPTPKPNDEAS